MDGSLLVFPVHWNNAKTSYSAGLTGCKTGPANMAVAVRLSAGGSGRVSSPSVGTPWLKMGLDARVGSGALLLPLPPNGREQGKHAWRSHHPLRLLHPYRRSLMPRRRSCSIECLLGSHFATTPSSKPCFRSFSLFPSHLSHLPLKPYAARYLVWYLDSNDFEFLTKCSFSVPLQSWIVPWMLLNFARC